MSEISREKLHAFLDDALSDSEAAQVEQALREFGAAAPGAAPGPAGARRGRALPGGHLAGERLTCLTREQLGSHLLQVLDDDEQDYIQFHLDVVQCPYCLANLADLQAAQKEPVPQARERRRRFFKTSAGFLDAVRDTQK